jgi:hypothetical protein
MTVDLLTSAIDEVRPQLASSTTKQRIHLLWATAKAARDFAATDVLLEAFMALALEVRLINERGYWTGEDVRADIRKYGREDMEHAIRWALRGWNPFEKGPFT